VEAGKESKSEAGSCQLKIRVQETRRIDEEDGETVIQGKKLRQ
jgi:hypothetical protein